MVAPSQVAKEMEVVGGAPEVSTAGYARGAQCDGVFRAMSLAVIFLTFHVLT